MNAFLLVHFIQKLSSYYGHCPGTDRSQGSLREYDIDVSFDRGVVRPPPAQAESRPMQEFQGFFPSVTHEKLPEPFDIWESHLAAANGRLILGEIEDAIFAETEVGCQWRDAIDNVRQFLFGGSQIGSDAMMVPSGQSSALNPWRATIHVFNELTPSSLGSFSITPTQLPPTPRAPSEFQNRSPSLSYAFQRF